MKKFKSGDRVIVDFNNRGRDTFMATVRDCTPEIASYDYTVHEFDLDVAVDHTHVMENEIILAQGYMQQQEAKKLLGVK